MADTPITPDHTAALAKLAEIPPGYVLAPCEPTEAMLIAARDWSAEKYGKPIGNDAAQGCWNVMISIMLGRRTNGYQPTTQGSERPTPPKTGSGVIPPRTASANPSGERPADDEAREVAASERISAAQAVYDEWMADFDPAGPDREVHAFDAMKAAIATADAMRRSEASPGKDCAKLAEIPAVGSEERERRDEDGFACEYDGSLAPHADDYTIFWDNGARWLLVQRDGKITIGRSPAEGRQCFTTTWDELFANRSGKLISSPPADNPATSGKEGGWSKHGSAEIVRRTRCMADETRDAVLWRDCCDLILERLGQPASPADALREPGFGEGRR